MLIDFFKNELDATKYWESNNQIKFDLAVDQLEAYLEWKGVWKIEKEWANYIDFLSELGDLQYHRGIRWIGSETLYFYNLSSKLAISDNYEPGYIQKVYPGDVIYKKTREWVYEGLTVEAIFRTNFSLYREGSFPRWYRDFDLNKNQKFVFSSLTQKFTYQNLTESFRGPTKGNWVFFSEITTCKTFIDDNKMFKQVNNDQGQSFYNEGVRNNDLIFLREDDEKEDFGATICTFTWTNDKGKLTKNTDGNLLVEAWKENGLKNTKEKNSNIADNFILHIKTTNVRHCSDSSIFLLPIDYFDVKWWIKVNNIWEPIQVDWTYSWCYCNRDNFNEEKDFYSKSGLFQPILKIIVKDYISENLDNLAIQIV